MSEERARQIEGKVWVCYNCGDVLREEPPLKNIVSVDDLYYRADGDLLVIEGEVTDEAITQALLGWVKKHEVTTEEAHVHPSSADWMDGAICAVTAGDLQFFDSPWQCTHCEDLYQNKEDAEKCCDWYYGERSYASRMFAPLVGKDYTDQIDQLRAIGTENAMLAADLLQQAEDDIILTDRQRTFINNQLEPTLHV